MGGYHNGQYKTQNTQKTLFRFDRQRGEKQRKHTKHKMFL